MMDRRVILDALRTAPYARDALGNVSVSVPEEVVSALSAVDPDHNIAINKLLREDAPPPDMEFVALRERLDDPGLSKFQRKLIAAPYLKKLHARAAKNISEAAALDERRMVLEQTLAAKKRLEAWTVNAGFALELNDCSRLHQLVEAMRLNQVIIEGVDYLPASETWTDKLDGWQPFVVEHDWARAFSGAEDYHEGMVRLPYERCAFELRVSGRCVIVFAQQGPDEAPNLLSFVKDDDIWLVAENPHVMGDAEPGGWWGLVVRQIRAICIALEAEVATHQVVRASAKLNKKREQTGKLPLYDYHVVQIHARSRAILPPYSGGGGTHRSPRLHFRRGHWRHFAEHRTWVRWTLVGHPELGWVDKEYRL